MANKRTATSDLNADNWNQDEEPEEAGTFQKAPEEILNRRVIKSGRRRLPQAEEINAKSAFGSFAGFKATSATNSSSPFGFLAKTNSESSTTTPSSSNSSSFLPSKSLTTNGSTKFAENGVGTHALASTNSLPSKDAVRTIPTITDKEKTSPKKPTEYYAKLKGLNQSVAQWIKTHVDANPVCILTPIFRDYEKYLKEIELKHGKEIESPKVTEKKLDTQFESKPVQKETSSTTEKKQENFIFGSSSAKSSLEGTSESWKPEKSVFGNPSTTTKLMFSAGDKSDNKNPFTATSSATSDKNPFLSKASTTEVAQEETSKKVEEKSSTGLPFSQTNFNTGNSNYASFSFGQSSSTNTASAGFSFGGGTPFSFGAAAAMKSQETAKSEEKEDEDEEPPKPEIKPITEEGSIYEQKCKVFVKKDGNYSDRGVGTLFLKPAPNDKMQLIVRAVNSLGNLLLNTLLTDSIPIKRLNNTNIMLVCLPLPTSEPPPVATLLRVKTSEEADALLEALEKHKK